MVLITITSTVGKTNKKKLKVPIASIILAVMVGQNVKSVKGEHQPCERRKMTSRAAKLKLTSQE